MTAKVDGPGGIIRTAAVQLAWKLAGNVSVESFNSTFAPRSPGLGFQDPQEDIEFRYSWQLIAQWLVGYSLGLLSPEDTISDAEDWFLGDTDEHSRLEVDFPMFDVAEAVSPSVCWALLPYLLDPLSLGTRRSVLRSNVDSSARTKRKQQGVFYTPADVAQFMANRVVSGMDRKETLTVLDPAAGSGVFLRAALAKQSSFGSMRVFGMDRVALAAELASYVLLATGGVEGWPTPWSAWHQYRIHYATLDTLRLVGFHPERDGLQLVREAADIRDQVRHSLQEGTYVEPAPASEVGHSLASVFPELEQGADAVLTNPPYAAIGSALTNDTAVRDRFMCTRGTRLTATTNVFPMFIEQANAFTHRSGCMSAVVPLSVTFGQGRHFRQLRRTMKGWGKDLEFCSFDRTPDALFGDDVKTRNTIMTTSPSQVPKVRTTGLIRWTSRTRSQLFEGIRPTEIDGSIDDLVPRLSSQKEFELYRSTKSVPSRMENWVASWSRWDPAVSVYEGQPSVYFGPTAYNWLNCVLDPKLLRSLGHTSTASYMAATMRSPGLAAASYAIASSRVAFFLWRSEGDAFHLTRGFLSTLPVPESVASTDRLAALGNQLWVDSIVNPICSENRGSKTIAVPPRSLELLDAIDRELVEALQLDLVFDLAEWHEGCVIVDQMDHGRRQRLNR